MAFLRAFTRIHPRMFHVKRESSILIGGDDGHHRGGRGGEKPGLGRSIRDGRTRNDELARSLSAETDPEKDTAQDAPTT